MAQFDLVLLDRDGVLNADRPDFVKNPGELEMIDGAADAVARLNRAGILVALVTNQSGVGRGLFDQNMLEIIHNELRSRLAAGGAKIDALFFCPDPPWAATDRRKPGPGMLNEAMRHFRKPADRTVMIGDSLRDMQAAKSAGCARILVRTGNGQKTLAEGRLNEVLPISIYDDLALAVSALLGNDDNGSDELEQPEIE